MPKDHLCISACGDLDELNAAIGQAHSLLASWSSLQEELEAIQKVLFGVGGEISARPGGKDRPRSAVTGEDVAFLESSIDEMEKDVTALKTFILPGGGPAGAALHVARTVCRRAERSVVGVNATRAVRPEILSFLNRLSDWLFVAARYVNHRERHPETPW